MFTDSVAVVGTVQGNTASSSVLFVSVAGIFVLAPPPVLPVIAIQGNTVPSSVPVSVESSSISGSVSRFPIARFPNQGNEKRAFQKNSQNIFCCRPGCSNTFLYDARVPDKIFCSGKCYNDLRLVRKRLLTGSA